MSNPLEGQQEATTDSTISQEKKDAIEAALNEIDSAILHLEAGGLSREQEDNLNRRVAELVDAHDLESGVQDPRATGIYPPLQPGERFVSEEDLPLLRQIQQKKASIRNKKVGAGVVLAAVAAMASRLMPSPSDSVEAPHVAVMAEQEQEKDLVPEEREAINWLKEMSPLEAEQRFGGAIKESRIEQERLLERAIAIAELRDLIEHRADQVAFQRYISKLQQTPRLKDGTLVVEAQIAALREDIRKTFDAFLINNTPAYQHAIQRLEQLESRLDMLTSNDLQLSLTQSQELSPDPTKDPGISKEYQQLLRLDSYLEQTQKRIDGEEQAMKSSTDLYDGWKELHKNK